MKIIFFISFLSGHHPSRAISHIINIAKFVSPSSILRGDINYLHHYYMWSLLTLSEINWLAVNCMQLTDCCCCCSMMWIMKEKMRIKYELFMRRKWEIKCVCFVIVYAMIYFFDDIDVKLLRFLFIFNELQVASFMITFFILKMPQKFLK